MLALRPGISFCIVDETVIFLDDRRDRYFALAGERAAQFLAIMKQGDASAPWARGFDTILHDVPTCIGIEPCKAERAYVDCKSTGRAGTIRVLLALVSMTVTLVQLRCRGFHRNIAPRRSGLAATFKDLERARRLLPAFQVALRIFPRRLECLPLALSLRTYLRWLSTGCDLVIGVKRDPFAAHCWIQIAGHVLCDRIERIGGFAPVRLVS